MMLAFIKLDGCDISMMSEEDWNKDRNIAVLQTDKILYSTFFVSECLNRSSSGQMMFFETKFERMIDSCQSPHFHILGDLNLP